MKGAADLGNQFWTDEDDDTYSDGDGGNDLPEPLRKYVRRLEKERNELKKQVEEFQKTQRKGRVADLVKSKGFAPDVVRIVPENLSDDDAVNKWLDEHASLFAKAAEEPAPNANTEGAKPEESGGAGIPPEEAQAMGAMQNVMANAVTSLPNQAALQALIQSTNSKDELDKLIQSAVGSAVQVR